MRLSLDVTTSYTPVTPNGDLPRPSATVRRSEKCTRSPTNAVKRREKVPNNYKLEQNPDLCDHTTFSRRSRHDLLALMAFLLRSMDLATAITGDPTTLSTRSWGCLLRVLRLHGDLTAFLPRSQRDYI